MDLHIQNRIRCQSRDALFVKSIQFVDSTMKELGIKYHVIGSCALQSYLEFFIRVPNDLDIVMSSEDMKSLFSWSMAQSVPIVTELGRAKMVLNTLPVHVIFDRMQLIDTSMNIIFSTLDVSFGNTKLFSKPVSLLDAEVHPIISVPALEVLLAIHILRPIDTNDISLLRRVLSDCKIDPKTLTDFILRHPDLVDIYKARVLMISRLLKKMGGLAEARRFDSLTDALQRNL